jgi:hypothetical protein
VVRPKRTIVPHITVTFTAVGDEIRGVRASVAPLSGAFLQHHQRLQDEYQSPQSWPKHVVIEYVWERYSDTDGPAGLFAMVSTCASRCKISGRNRLYKALLLFDRSLRSREPFLPLNPPPLIYKYVYQDFLISILKTLTRRQTLTCVAVIPHSSPCYTFALYP